MPQRGEKGACEAYIKRMLRLRLTLILLTVLLLSVIRDPGAVDVGLQTEWGLNLYPAFKACLV